MIVLIYTRTDEIASNRASQLAAKRTNVLILNVLFVFFCVYIKILKKNDIFWDRILDNNICSYIS